MQIILHQLIRREVDCSSGCTRFCSLLQQPHKIFPCIAMADLRVQPSGVASYMEGPVVLDRRIVPVELFFKGIGCEDVVAYLEFLHDDGKPLGICWIQEYAAVVHDGVRLG